MSKNGGNQPAASKGCEWASFNDSKLLTRQGQRRRRATATAEEEVEKDDISVTAIHRDNDDDHANYNTRGTGEDEDAEGGKLRSVALSGARLSVNDPL